MNTQKKHPILIFSLPLILAAVSISCNLSSILNSTGTVAEIEPTRTPRPTFTPSTEQFVNVAIENTPAAEVAQPADQAAVEAAPEEQTEAEPTPTSTLVVLEEPTEVVPEEQGPASVTILQDMNVRGGPGTNYPVIGPGPAGQTANILGRNDDNSWLQVEYPSADGTGWVYAPLVQINGNTEGIAIASAPPPPPTPVPEPVEPPPPPPPTAIPYQFTPTGWHASGNPGIIHFKGRIKDEAGNLVNGYSILIDNWAWSIMSHPTGASNHYPEKGDGEWDVVFPNENLSDGVGSWYLSVVLYTCPDFLSRFDAQCKQFDRLSEEVYIEVNWPDETVINADWICHWDCNKGLYVDGFRR